MESKKNTILIDEIPEIKILQKEFFKLADVKKLLTFFLYLHVLIVFFFRVEGILNFFLDSFIMPYLLGAKVTNNLVIGMDNNLHAQLQSSIETINNKQFFATISEIIFFIVVYFLLSFFLYRIVKCIKLIKPSKTSLSPLRTLILSLIPIVNIVYIARTFPVLLKECVYKQENQNSKVNYLVVLFWPYVFLVYITVYVVQILFLNISIINNLEAYADILNLHVSADYLSAFITIMTIYITSSLFSYLQNYYKQLSLENSENINS